MSKDKLKLSFSSTGDYRTCPNKYKFKYIDNLVSMDQGASLKFGGAVDAGINTILEGKDNYIDVFMDLVEDDKQRGWKFTFDDPNVFYTRRDYNENTLAGEDFEKISEWEKELGTSLKDCLDAEKAKKYKRFNGNNLKFFNRICWLSMMRLGMMMLDAYKNKVMPQITKVHATQKKIEINFGDKVGVVGYIDLIADFEGHNTPIILDNKTARNTYDFDAILRSDQLRIYLQATKDKYKTNKVGYIVLPKTLETAFKCDTCKKEKPKGERARKCLEEGCNGNYIKQYTVEPQIMIDEYSEEDLKSYMSEFINIAKLIKSGLFYKNYDSCMKYNSKCAYYNLCHYGNSLGLVNKFRV